MSHPLDQILSEFRRFSSDPDAPCAALTKSRPFAEWLDKNDPLAEHRASFHFPKISSSGKPYLYLCGNSLGLQHKDVSASVEQELRKWRDQAVEGHFLPPNPWFEIDDILRSDMANIVGAKPSEVVLMNSLTTNLHLLLAAFYRPSGRRTKILAEAYPFPSDTHAIASQVQHHGLDPQEHFLHITSLGVQVHPEEGPSIITTKAILEAIEAIGDEVAVLLLGGIHFLTGQFFDLSTITAAAHAKGVLVGVDAAHAAGNVPLHLHESGVDFCCWCTYKYLNGGPGNIGGVFVHERHTSVDSGKATPLRGWWGHSRASRFGLERSFVPAEGAAAFQLSNPCVLSLMSLAPSVRLMATVGISALRAKSLRLTAYLEYLLLQRLVGRIEIITPSDPSERGAQLSIRIVPGALKSRQAPTAAYANGTDLGNDADALQRQLLNDGIMCDNRPPDIIRLAPAPLYNSYIDVYDCVEKLAARFN